jgi:hypothetical protein
MKISVKVSNSFRFEAELPAEANFRLREMYEVTSPDFGGGHSSILEKIFETKEEATSCIACGLGQQVLHEHPRKAEYFVTSCVFAGTTYKVATKGGSNSFHLVGHAEFPPVFSVLAKLTNDEIALLKKHFGSNP